MTDATNAPSITPALLADMVENEENLTMTAVTILNLLRQLGIDKVEGSYNGSGDSPDACDVIGYVEVKKTTSEPSPDEQLEVTEYAQLDETADARLQPYKEAIGEFVFKMSFDHWGGWYNNDGGYGTGIFYVSDAEPRVTIDHYAYETTSSLQGEHEYKV